MGNGQFCLSVSLFNHLSASQSDTLDPNGSLRRKDGGRLKLRDIWMEYKHMKFLFVCFWT